MGADHEFKRSEDGLEREYRRSKKRGEDASPGVEYKRREDDEGDMIQGFKRSEELNPFRRN